MASTRDIQRRIKSVKNTKKITKAMELVSASKMRKAVEAVLATRSYANLSWLTVLNLAEVAKHDRNLHKLLNPSYVKVSEGKSTKVGVILITSNKGLCGGFNTSIVNKVVKSIKQTFPPALPTGQAGPLLSKEGVAKGSVEHEFVLLGKKGAQVNYKFGYNLAAEFDKPDVITEVEEVIPVAKMLIKDYLNGKYDKVMLAYTDFVSAAKQVPRVKQLLPVNLDERDEFLGQTSPPSFVKTTEDKPDPLLSKDGGAKEEKFVNSEYIFEPSAKQVLDEMIPRLIEIQMFQAMLESNASEHSARMMAMRNATDAAGDMIDELTLTYNKARQASITAEIAEIAGGAVALRPHP
ncbi:MAG: FoF1 ATP synthase subunit gamma [Candidatus Falkowbacteria bacterium]